MKLIFVENRYKTYMFDAIAKKMAKEHEIYWIQQNPQFKPTVGKVFKIPFPKKRDLKFYSNNENPLYNNILKSDRQLNFFNKKDSRYFYYYAKILEDYISKVTPDFVFGEATAFHELLLVEICKKSKILYLNPSSCRYPPGRFSFYKNDSVFPFKGSEEQLSKADANSIIDVIVNRSSKPDYMKKIAMKRSKIIKDKLKILGGYYLGEKFNTPSPIVKYRLEKNKEKNIAIWDENSIMTINKNVFSIVYPLHMQPEANIDVWGREKRDQLKSIKEVSSQLAENQILYIKPNPKSKYELSKELITFIQETSNVQMIHHKISMDAIFKQIDLFITVNGTIALECIFANKPILTLVNGFFNNAGNCLFLSNVKSLQNQISDIKSNNFPILLRDEKIAFLNLINKTSFKGIISDPYHSEYSVSEENVIDVVKAFNIILSSKV